MNSSFFKIWINSAQVSASDKTQIQKFSSSKREKYFGHLVQFSAGFRGSIALGANCFNKYTVKVIALTLVKIWLKPHQKNKVLIFHDHRHQSVETSKLLATIFQIYGIQSYFFTNNQPVPTPFLSFILTHSPEFQGGIMITASHNNKNTNGIKLFDKDGYPWTSKENTKINKLLQDDYEKLLNQKLDFDNYQTVPEIAIHWKEKYLKKVLHFIQKTTNLSIQNQNKIHILYSSLHGVGINWTDNLLKRANYQLTLVPLQKAMDPNFSTVTEPNPEKDSAFKLAKDLTINKKMKPNLIILNDGDADRMRATCFYKNKFRYLSGNEIGLLFTYFLLKERKRKGTIYCSYVSTPLVEKIAADFDCQVVRTATGFGNLASAYRKKNKSQFVLAFEESIGFLVNPDINHDKDGLQATLLLAEISAFCLQNNTNLIDYLQIIYNKYGCCYTETKSCSLTRKEHYIQLFNSLKINNNDKLSPFILIQKKKQPKVTSHLNSNINPLFFFYFKENNVLVNFAFRCSQTTSAVKLYFFVPNSKSKCQSKKIIARSESLTRELFKNLVNAKLESII